MFLSLKKSKKTSSFRVVTGIILAAFLSSLPVNAQAQLQADVLAGPAVFAPPLIKGITIDPQDPLKFDFLIDVGNEDFRFQPEEDRAAEYRKLIRYFLASLTVPEKNLWVNLSPYEKDRIIPEDFGKTEMGRDLLGQDYILKQITAAMLHPEEDLGKEFWQKVYKQAEEKFGTIDIPVNTFNKVWIVPDKASVYEKDNTVLLIESHLKVMLEEDYVALANQKASAESFAPAKDINEIGAQVVREIIIPAIEKEVNEGKDFALLRQINNSLILATWYKAALKESLLGKVYVDRGKTDGVDQDDIADNQRIYEEYLEAFKKGAYNFIKEEVDPLTQEVIPRKYFSGGYTTTLASSPLSERIKKVFSGPEVQAVLSSTSIERVSANLAEAPKDPGRRNILRGAAAGVLASLIPDPGSAAQLWADNLVKIVEVEDGENFESLIDQYFGFDGLLGKLDPVKRAEILDAVFMMVKAENPQIKFGSITDVLPRGLKIRFTEANDYLNFKVYMAFSNVVAQQSVDADGQKQVVYYVVSNIAKDVSPVFSGTAFNFVKYGVVVNLAEVKQDLNNLKELRAKVSTADPGGIEFFLGQVYERILKGMSDKDMLTYLFNDVLGHEIAHGTMRADFQITSPRSWVGKLMRSQMAGLSRAEIWAYLLQLSRSNLPELRFNQLKVMAMSSPSRFLSGDVMVPASRILVWQVLEELNYSKFLSDRSVAEEEAKQGPMTGQQKEPFIRAATRSWNDHPEVQISFNKIETIDQFLATKTRPELQEAARKAFLRLTRQEKIPQIPANLQPPKEVLDRVLSASSSVFDSLPGMVKTAEPASWVQFSKIRQDELILTTIESRLSAIKALLNLSAGTGPAERSMSVAAEPLTLLKEIVFYLGFIEGIKDNKPADKEARLKVILEGKRVFGAVLSWALPWYGESPAAVEKLLKDRAQPADVELLIKTRNDNIPVSSLRQVVLAIESLKAAQPQPVLFSMLDRTLTQIQRDNSDLIANRMLALFAERKPGKDTNLTAKERADLSRGLARNTFALNNILQRIGLSWKEFLQMNEDITQKLAEEERIEGELSAETMRFAKRLQQVQGTTKPGEFTSDPKLYALLRKLKYGTISRVNMSDVITLAELLQVVPQDLWPEEDLGTLNFTGEAATETAAASSSVGGINLDPANLTLQIKRDGKGVPLPLQLQDIESIDINGFTPVIINITPVPSLPLLLGVNITAEEPVLSSSK